MERSASRTASQSTRKAGVGKEDSTSGRGGLVHRQKETAQYLADLILELRVMAKSAQLYHVMVPLEYAYYEAFAAANKVDVPEEEVARLMELSTVTEKLDHPTDDY